MKTMILAAFAALSLATAVVPSYAATFRSGSTVAGDSTATRMQQTGTFSGN